jgi:hypothetical protein
MTCAWVTPRWQRRCTIIERHYHWPAWGRLARAGDTPGRLMLLVWAPRWWPKLLRRKI